MVRARGFVLGVAAICFGLLAGSPANAGPAEADATISKNRSGPYVDDVVSFNLDEGEKKTAYIKVKNGGSADGDFRLESTDDPASYRLRWFTRFKDGQNIT